MRPHSPFHAGEIEVQARLGVRDIEAWASRVIRPYLPDEHREFHTSQPFLVAAARDARGRAWATLLAGPEGFTTSPDDQTLRIDAQLVPGDALEHALAVGSDLGILGIELATRRRNRVNGKVRRDGSTLVFSVEQTFGNCPQYIHERDWERVEPGNSAPMHSTALSNSQQAWISAADTLFISSGHRGEGDSPTFGMDASHRGGDPGFIQVKGASRITFPDYAGNNHFNTIGNLVSDPRVGLLLIDFPTGSMLQITGVASISWGGPEVTATPGARRLVHIDIDEVIELPVALPFRWSKAGAGVRSLRLIEKIKESDDVTSFVFTARDGGPLAPFKAGQHLPLELDIPGQSERVRRTYSLSNGPEAERYRITVKRESQGLASRFLHDQIEAGAILQARDPAGEFLLGCSKSPAVFISAGVGLTPLLSMLHRVIELDSGRPIWWLHGAKDGAHHPLADEVNALAAAHTNLKTQIAYSKPVPEDVLGRDFDSPGRITDAQIAQSASDPDAHYYVCGPVAFMAMVQEKLEARGVSSQRITTETFGPVGS